jgi:hypothetical protein
LDELTQQDAVIPTENLLLNPFSYMGNVASRIQGLGGNAPGHDTAYVFHTHYVEAAPGRAKFTVRFANLTGRGGTLMLRIHMLPMEEDAKARLVNSERISMSRLIAHGGETSINFEGFRGMSFALYGTIHDNTDACADDLQVILDHPAHPDSRDGTTPIEGKNTQFSAKGISPTARFLVTEQTSLAKPVTQVATHRQLREAAGTAWLRMLDTEPTTDLGRWRAAYILEALKKYGVLEAEAIGLGFDWADSPIPAMIAASGTIVHIVQPRHPFPPEHEHTPLAGLERPGICDPHAFFERVTTRRADLAPLQHNLRNFDFLWSTNFCERFMSANSAVGFIQDTIAYLRPGGVAVHVLPFDVASIRRAVALPNMMVAQRNQIERLALLIISQNHEISQFRLDDETPLLDDDIGAIGIVIRKAPSGY